jgi:predicted N-acetyltransferase YhbS
VLSTRDVVIRPLRETDAEAVCTFLNRLNIGPNHWGLPYEPEALRESLLDHAVVEYLVGTVGDQVVAVFHFSPTQQGESSVEGVFGQLIVVDPQFRGTRVAEKLARQGLQYLISAGYDRLEGTARADGASLRLQKRAGFRQVSDAPVGDEEVVHLVNHMSLVVRYVFRAFKADRGALGLKGGLIPLGDTDPFSLAALPPVGKGALESDRVPWHGSSVVEYALRLPGRAGQLSCLVDLDADAVTSVTGSDVTFACWPVDDRRSTAPGQPTPMWITLINHRSGPIEIEVEAEDPDRVVHEGVLAAGDTWEGEVGFAPTQPGRARFTVNTSVRGVDGTSPRQFSVTTSVDVVAQGATTNDRDAHRPAHRSGPNRAEVGSAEWRLTTRALSVAMSSATGTIVVSHVPTGERLLQEVWPDVGPPYPTTHRRPLRRPLRLVELAVRDGVPELAVETVANVWVTRDPNVALAHASARSLDGLVLCRRLRLVDSHLLEVTSTLRRERGEVSAEDGHALRIWPWALVPSPSIVVPLEAGTLVSPVLHFGFPFGLDNVEHLREVDLPSDPADIPAGWCAFEGGEWVAGLAWRDATGLRFGQRWMPSVLFATPPLGPGDQVDLPAYRLSGGRGDHRLVADTAFAEAKGLVAPRLTGRLPLALDVLPVIADPSGRARLSGHVRVVAGRARPGRVGVDGDAAEGTAALDAPLAVDLAADTASLPGVHEVGVAWQEADGIMRWRVPTIVPAASTAVLLDEQEGAWVVDNGYLRFALSSQDDGAVVSLAVEGEELLSDGQTPGLARFHVVDPAREWIVHPAPVDVPWRFDVAPWAAEADDWFGVQLHGTPGERWPALAADVVFATRRGAPVVLAAATFSSASDDDRLLDGCFSLVAPRRPRSSATVFRSDGEVELGAEQAFDGSGTDAPRVAYGRDVVVLSTGRHRLALTAADADVSVAQWPGWHLSVNRPLTLHASRATRLDVWLGVGTAGTEALRRLPELTARVLGR